MNKILSRNSVKPDWETENEIMITASGGRTDVIVASSAKSLMRI